MSSILLVTAGAVITYMGVILGITRERSRKPKPPAEPNLFCGCGDELSFHDGLGECKKVEQWMAGNLMRQVGEYVPEAIPCGCQQYTGDLPADWYARNLG